MRTPSDITIVIPVFSQLAVGVCVLHMALEVSASSCRPPGCGEEAERGTAHHPGNERWWLLDHRLLWGKSWHRVVVQNRPPVSKGWKRNFRGGRIRGSPPDSARCCTASGFLFFRRGLVRSPCSLRPSSLYGRDLIGIAMSLCRAIAIGVLSVPASQTQPDILGLM